MEFSKSRNMKTTKLFQVQSEQQKFKEHLATPSASCKIDPKRELLKNAPE